jgi:hypothetical protein
MLFLNYLFKEISNPNERKRVLRGPEVSTVFLISKEECMLEFFCLSVSKYRARFLRKA